MAESLAGFGRRSSEARYVEHAQSLAELASPPGNRLEALRGNLQGSHSVRINDQWRIVFRWEAGAAYHVRVVDYQR